jgi:hypothetical protein
MILALASAALPFVAAQSTATKPCVVYFYNTEGASFECAGAEISAENCLRIALAPQKRSTPGGSISHVYDSCTMDVGTDIAYDDLVADCTSLGGEVFIEDEEGHELPDTGSCDPSANMRPDPTSSTSAARLHRREFRA